MTFQTKSDGDELPASDFDESIGNLRLQVKKYERTSEITGISGTVDTVSITPESTNNIILGAYMQVDVKGDNGSEGHVHFNGYSFGAGPDEWRTARRHMIMSGSGDSSYSWDVTHLNTETHSKNLLIYIYFLDSGV